jgi:hypothetical protein
MNFGLVGDFDVMYDIDQFALDLHDSLAELAEAAGHTISSPPPDAPAAEIIASDLADAAN